MKRLVECQYTDLLTGEAWARVFLFDAATGERYEATKKEIEGAPLPDRYREYWGGNEQ